MIHKEEDMHRRQLKYHTDLIIDNLSDKQKTKRHTQHKIGGIETKKLLN